MIKNLSKLSNDIGLISQEKQLLERQNAELQIEYDKLVARMINARECTECKYKVNFHCHTKYSDGVNTMEECVKEYKNQGFECAITSDHIYPSKELTSWTNTREGFTKQVAEAKVLSKKYNIPVIVGAELNLYLEEVLVYNHDLIYKIFDIIDEAPDDSSPADICKVIREAFPSLIKEYGDFPILCHPGMDENDAERMNPVYEVLKGFEYYHDQICMFKGREIPDIIADKFFISNSDSHSIENLKYTFNLVDTPIKSYEDLFKITKMTPKIYLDRAGVHFESITL